MFPVHDVLLEEAANEQDAADDDADNTPGRRWRRVLRVVPYRQHSDPDEDRHEADEGQADPGQTILGQMARTNSLERCLASGPETADEGLIIII